MKKKDMYIDYKKSRRIDSSKRKRVTVKKAILTTCLILVLGGLALGGYFYVKGSFPLPFTDIYYNQLNFFNKNDNLIEDSNNNEQEGLIIKISNNIKLPTENTTDSNIVESKANESQEELTDAISRNVVNDSKEDEQKNKIKETETVPVATRPQSIKGIYVTGQKAGISEYLEELTAIVDETEVNAMVIDIKNDSGEITYKIDLALAEEIGAGTNYIRDIKDLVSKLKEKDIYLIARIVAFKDPILAEKKQEYSLKNKDGSLFQDKNGDKWVNPYKKEVWNYLVDIGKAAVELGFDEIQYDYIRFSTDKGMKNVDFGKEAEGKSKIDCITEFTAYLSDNLKPLGVFVSADVYGTIIDSKVDAEIVGQDYRKMAEHLDYICPMIYPSHYQDGSYGITYPDKEPYNLILAALDKSKQVLEGENNTEVAKVRPWLQDFTASWLKNHISYGPDEIRAQIQAVYDAGYDEWLLWNGSNHYSKDGLLKE